MATLQGCFPLSIDERALSDQLEQKIAKRLEASDVDMRIAVAELLRPFNTAEPTSSLNAALLECLNKEWVSEGAATVVRGSAACIKQLNRLQNSEAVQGILQQLERADLDGKLVESIARF